MTPTKKESDITFEELDGRVTPRLTVIVDGKTKSGKTWFALSAPGPLGIISNDANTLEIANKWKRKDPAKQIHYKEFIKSPLWQVQAGDDINVIKEHWRKFREAYYRLLEIKSIRTVIVDTHTVQWDDCKLAFVGRYKPDPTSPVDKEGKPTGQAVSIQRTIQRDLGEPKRDIREMINAAGDKNLILLCHSEPEYKNDVRTGKMGRKGMPGVEYLSQCEVQCFRDETSGEFVARMLSSTANSSIRGREGALEFDRTNGKSKWKPSSDELVSDDINFQMVALAVFPSTEWEDWT